MNQLRFEYRPSSGEEEAKRYLEFNVGDRVIYPFLTDRHLVYQQGDTGKVLETYKSVGDYRCSIVLWERTQERTYMCNYFLALAEPPKPKWRI